MTILRIKSSIKPGLLKSKLFQGTWWAFFGALGILIAGTTFPRDLLTIWGLPILILGLLLITIGLVPYRITNKLITTPHEIIYDGSHLIFLKMGKPKYEIPKEAIEKITYIERRHLYGIRLRTKNKKKFFFPYFTHTSFESLKDRLESSHAS